ncbi:hypothetical protein SERLA73DRAFT_132548 [Serpula lacrymans var. lacrymans S7.3]|uniref:Fms interacting protein n=1 Tax=Serpula lacrymans var. lacrymans (strain S7.3) TaxID=936435 RepID=F8PP26_SERL3|nr:hypothetical protein SERLA73DRAFT_132548 [Serpula lacrymans var. lacrymans S7.3]
MADRAVSEDIAIEHLRELVSPAFLDNDTTAMHIRASALVARLKALNRNANAATRAHKQATAEARHEMDQTHLGLQNLLYEKRHLEREIDKCRQFASIYQDVPLYSLDEFKQLAPLEARGDDVLNNPHQLMLNRLSFELAERQRSELLKQSKSKLATMDSVKSQIDILMKAAADIQKRVDELVPPIPPSNRNTPIPG